MEYARLLYVYVHAYTYDYSVYSTIWDIMSLSYHIVRIHSTAIECPLGMIYQQCGTLCPQTCDNADTTICPSECAEDVSVQMGLLYQMEYVSIH